MTINELRQAPPQTKQYLDAQLLAIGPAKVVNTPRGQRNVQELQVVDRERVQEKIAYWYDTDKPDFAMPPQQVNQWLQWVVKTKPNGQYLNISGYPEKAAAPPQQATQLTPTTQAIIDEARNRSPQQAATAIQDHLGGTVRPNPNTYTPPAQTPQPTQQDYKAKEREKVLGMCFTNIMQGKVVNTPCTELEKDLAEIAAMWRCAAMCIDGTGQVQEIQPQQLPEPPF